jgi:hypothetical protein
MEPHPGRQAGDGAGGLAEAAGCGGEGQAGADEGSRVWKRSIGIRGGERSGADGWLFCDKNSKLDYSKER